MMSEDQTLNGVLTALIIAVLSSLGTLGLPTFWKWVNGKIDTSQQRQQIHHELEHETQQIENQKDLALIRAQQVFEAELAELRETKRLQMTQILDQAAEISKLKNLEHVVDEYRNQRTLLIAWIEEQSGSHLRKDNLISQLKNEIQILETMISVPYTDADG